MDIKAAFDRGYKETLEDEEKLKLERKVKGSFITKWIGEPVVPFHSYSEKPLWYAYVAGMVFAQAEIIKGRG